MVRLARKAVAAAVALSGVEAVVAEAIAEGASPMEAGAATGASGFPIFLPSREGPVVN